MFSGSIHPLCAATLLPRGSIACPPKHLTRDRQLRDAAQLDLFNTRDPHRFSCAVTATGSDFTTILRWMFADSAAVSGVSPTCIPDSSNGIDLFCLRCPLPLAVNDADFMSSLLFGFASGSIGFSLGSGAADSVSGTATVALSLLFYLCSPLRTSSASASLITSFPRSNLSAPCGVVLRHSSIRILQRSECACALLLSLIALQPGHDSLPLDSCSLEGQRRDWNGVHLNFWPVHCPLSIRHPPRYSNHAIDGFCVPSVLRFQSPNSKPNPVLISGVHPDPRIRGDLPCQHLFSERDKALRRLVAVQSLKWRPPVTPVTTFLAPGRCIRRAPPTMV